MSRFRLLSALVAGLFMFPAATLASPDCTLIQDLSGFDPAGSGGMAVDAWGGFAIADPAGDRILKSHTTGGPLVEVWGSRGFGPGEFRDPMDVAIGPDGMVYVADTGNHRIQKFDPLGCYLAQWGTGGRDPGQFRKVVAVAVDGEGFLYALDARNFTVQKFTPDGALVGLWTIPAPGGGGSSGGHLEHFEGLAADVVPGNRPSDLVVDRQGNVHVLFSDQGRVATFDAAGRLIRVWGSLGTAPGQLLDPVALGICPGSDMVYVADSGNARIQLFTGSGYFVEAWGDIDLAPGAVVRGRRLPGDHFRVPLSDEANLPLPATLVFPRGVGVNGVGQIYVVDAGSEALVAFSFRRCPTRTETAIRPASCASTIDPTRYEEHQVVIPGAEGFSAQGANLHDLWLGKDVLPLAVRVEDIAYRSLREGHCVHHPLDGREDLVMTFRGTDLLAVAGLEDPGQTGEITLHGHDLDGVPFWGTGTVTSGRTAVDDDGGRGRDHFEQFTYELPVAATVHTEIFDVSGRLVDRLPVEVRGAGIQRLSWDAGGHPAGIYFARVRAGEDVFVRKIVTR